MSSRGSRRQGNYRTVSSSAREPGKRGAAATREPDGVRRQRAGPFITKGALRQEPPTRPWRRGSSEAGRRFGSAGALCKGDLEVRWAGSVMEPSLRKLSSRRRTATQHLSTVKDSVPE